MQQKHFVLIVTGLFQLFFLKPAGKFNFLQT